MLDVWRDTIAKKKDVTIEKTFCWAIAPLKIPVVPFFFPVMDLKVDRNMLGTTEMHHYIKAWEKEI